MRLEKTVLEQLQRAAASSEGEICGALIGTTRDIVGSVAMHNRSRDPASSFFISASDVLELQQRGIDVSGVYHSHPHSSAVPSARDLEQAVPGYIYLILSRDGEARAWQLREDRSSFDEIEWLTE